MKRHSRQDRQNDVQQNTDTLLRYLEKMIQQSQTRRRLPWFTIFLLCIVVVLFLEGNDLTERSEDFYHFTATQVRLDEENFRKIQNTTMFWEWLEAQAVTMVSAAQKRLDPQDPNQLFSFLLVRQYQTNNSAENCNTEAMLKFLPTTVYDKFRKTCATQYSPSALETAPLGEGADTTGFSVNKPPWVTEAWRSSNPEGAKYPKQVTSLTLQGEIADYAEITKAYSLLFTLHMTPDAIRQEVAALKRLTWVGIDTRAIVVEVLTYNAAIKRFLICSFLLEISPGTAWVKSIFGDRFMIFSVDDPAGVMLLILHCTCILFLLVDTLKCVVDAWRNRALSDGRGLSWRVVNQIGFFAVLQTSAFVMFCWAAYLRCVLWSEGITIDADTMAFSTAEFKVNRDAPGDDPNLPEYLALWEWFAMYADYFESARNVLTLAGLLLWLRIFEFLQHFTRLSILTETVSSSIRECVVIIIIFVIILMGFTLGFTLLWGNLSQYRNVAQTATSLLIMAQTGGTIQYQAQEREQPVLTPLLVTVYLALTTFIIINMVISVITISFKMVQNAMEQGAPWTFAAFIRSAQNWLELRWNRICPPEEDYDHERHGSGDPERGDVDAAGPGVVEAGGDPGGGLRSHYKAHRILTEFIQKRKKANPDQKVSLSEEEYFEEMHGNDHPITKQAVSDTFGKASREIRATSAAIKISEQAADAITDLLVTIESSVKRIGTMESDMATLDALQERLLEQLESFEDYLRAATAYAELTQAQREASDGIEGLMKESQDTARFADVITEQHDVITRGARKTGDMRQQQRSQSVLCASFRKHAEEKFKKLGREINRSLADAIPTNRMGQHAPVVLRQGKGKGIIGSVEAHGYIRQPHDDMDDEAAILYQHIADAGKLAPPPPRKNGPSSPQAGSRHKPMDEQGKHPRKLSLSDRKDIKDRMQKQVDDGDEGGPPQENRGSPVSPR